MSAKNGRNKKCRICRKTFYVSKSKDHLKFCSYRCAWDGRKKSYSGKGNPYYGKKHSKNIREKMSGVRHHNWKGGINRHPEGYVYVLSKSHPRRNKAGYVYQHILVMEEHLGRYLNRKEVVHHINGIKDDNRIKNLQLFSSNAEHMRHHHV